MTSRVSGGAAGGRVQTSASGLGLELDGDLALLLVLGDGLDHRPDPAVAGGLGQHPDLPGPQRRQVGHAVLSGDGWLGDGAVAGGRLVVHGEPGPRDALSGLGADHADAEAVGRQVEVETLVFEDGLPEIVGVSAALVADELDEDLVIAGPEEEGLVGALVVGVDEDLLPRLDGVGAEGDGGGVGLVAAEDPAGDGDGPGLEEDGGVPAAPQVDSFPAGPRSRLEDGFQLSGRQVLEAGRRRLRRELPGLDGVSPGKLEHREGEAVSSQYLREPNLHVQGRQRLQVGLEALHPAGAQGDLPRGQELSAGAGLDLDVAALQAVPDGVDAIRRGYQDIGRPAPSLGIAGQDLDFGLGVVGHQVPAVQEGHKITSLGRRPRSHLHHLTGPDGDGSGEAQVLLPIRVPESRHDGTLGHGRGVLTPAARRCRAGRTEPWGTGPVRPGRGARMPPGKPEVGARTEETMLEDWLRELLRDMRRELTAIYGDRLKGLYLFGSRARGEAAPDSDVDLLIVLDEVGHYYGELERTAELVSSLSLRHDVSISRVFVPAAEWQRGEGPFLLTAREDAIAA